MANFKPLYTNVGQVKLYLRNKAPVNINTNWFNDLSNQEINKFIVNAEVRVENDLSKQYLIPFININGGDFSSLPRRAQITIQDMATWKSVLLILQTYYGSTDGVRGTAYIQSCQEQYDALLTECTALDQYGQNVNTPLADVKLNKNASYRSDAGAPSPIVATIGAISCDNTAISRRKLTNLNKNLWYGYYGIPY